MEIADRRLEMTIRLSEFDLPPMQDVLIIGRKAPIGSEAARRMADAMAPDQYEFIRVDAGPVEGIIVRKRLLDLCPKETLIPLLLEEVKNLAPESAVVKAQVTMGIVINRQVAL